MSAASSRNAAQVCRTCGNPPRMTPYGTGWKCDTCNRYCIPCDPADARRSTETPHTCRNPIPPTAIVRFVWPAPPGTSFDQSVCDRLVGQTVGKGKVLSAYLVDDGWGVGMVLDWTPGGES